MADNARTNKHTAADPSAVQSSDVERLRTEAEQARQSGDTARAEQLDAQVREAEAK